MPGHRHGERGAFQALVTCLEQHGHGDLGVLVGREGGEPGVRAPVTRRVDHLADLGGARLARDLTPFRLVL